MRDAALVAAGGAAGAFARYLVGVWWARNGTSPFPWHTFAINILGAFLLGMLMAAALKRGDIATPLVLLLGAGFLGGFTTFSTLAYESIVLLERGATGEALANVFGSGAAGLVAAWVGITLGRTL